MDIVTIDFETYYSKEYTLKEMTTEQYVRDDRFEIVGVGVKVGSNPVDTFTGDYVEVGRFLRSLDYTDKAILCHNTAFDGAILSWHYGIKPALWLDTYSMARALHSQTVGLSLAALARHYRLGEKGTEVVQTKGKRRGDFTPQEMDRYMSYCHNDVELTYQLFRRMSAGFPPAQLLLIDRVVRMYTEPRIVLDKDVLQAHYDKVIEEKQILLDAVSGGKADPRMKSVLMSNCKLAALLKLLGVAPPTKVSERTGKPTWAFAKTDKEFTALQDHPNPIVSTVVQARLGIKGTIRETRAEALMAVAERGLLPVMLNYYGAHTGRLSGGDGLNIQNLPSRQDKDIRRALTAPDGHQLVVIDLSQIEARVLAWLAGQEDLVDAFREARDVYCEFASDIYGRTITKADKTERFVGKTAVLSLGYGSGHMKFRDMLRIQGGVNIDEAEAQRIVRLYRWKNNWIVSYWRELGNMLKALSMGIEGVVKKDVVTYGDYKVNLPNGMSISYNALSAKQNGFAYLNVPKCYNDWVAGKEVSGNKWVKLYGGKCAENITQALAGVIVNEHLVRISTKYPVVFQVHDEVVFVAPDDKAEEALSWGIKVMSQPPKWGPDIPVACEGGYAKNYGDVEK